MKFEPIIANTDVDVHPALVGRYEETAGGCWVWLGPVDKDGYGKIEINRRTRRTHRISFEHSTGKSPPMVCHTCDTPACIRPTHLFAGDAVSNAADARAKGRNTRGSKQVTAKLDEAAAQAIRERRAAGETQRALALEYGVSASTISAVVGHKKWTHVGGPKASADNKVRSQRRLSTEVVDAIRAATGTQREIARSCGVSQQTIQSIKTGKRWK